MERQKFSWTAFIPLGLACALGIIWIGVEIYLSPLATVLPEEKNTTIARLLNQLRQAFDEQEGHMLESTYANLESQSALLRAARRVGLSSLNPLLERLSVDIKSLIQDQTGDYQSQSDWARESILLLKQMMTLLSSMQQQELQLQVQIEQILNRVGGNEWNEMAIQLQKQALYVQVGEFKSALKQHEQVFVHYLIKNLQKATQQQSFSYQRLKMWGFYFYVVILLLNVISLWGFYKYFTKYQKLYLNWQHGQHTQDIQQSMLLKQEHHLARLQVEDELLKLQQRALMDSIRSVLMIFDDSLGLRLLNHAAKQYFALLQDPVLNHKVSQIEKLKPLVDALGGLDTLYGLVDSHDFFEISELEVHMPQGVIWFFVKISPFFDEVGKMRGLMLIADDKTTEVLSRHKLLQGERLAALGQLSAQVAHEIRNPLSAILLNVDLLSDVLNSLPMPNPQLLNTQHMLASMAHEIQRLTDMTETYLQLARFKTPQLTACDMHELLAELILFLSESLKQQQIQVDLALNAQQYFVLADVNQMRQALLNVIKNSIESMPLCGRIHVQTKLDLDNNTFVLMITDTGEGISERDQKKIFDPFYSTKHSGTGLGLPLTQQIIHEHGGQIFLESQLGQGTQIKIILPACQE